MKRKKYKKYNMSDKRKLEDLKKANFDKRIDVFIKRNQGWTFTQIAKLYDCSPQSVCYLYSKVKDMSVDELENQRKLLVDNEVK